MAARCGDFERAARHRLALDVGQIRAGTKSDAEFDKAVAAAPDQNVLSAERALQRLGYVVKPDGVVSPELRKTIEKFERDNGLPPTGQLGPKVVKLLSARTAAQR